MLVEVEIKKRHRGDKTYFVVPIKMYPKEVLTWNPKAGEKTERTRNTLRLNLGEDI